MAGVLFNAIFLDHLDADVEHLRRMNALLAHQSWQPGQLPSAQVWPPDATFARSQVKLELTDAAAEVARGMRRVSPKYIPREWMLAEAVRRSQHRPRPTLAPTCDC